MNAAIISFIFTAIGVLLFLILAIWRRNQIYRQEEQAEREKQEKQ